MNIRYAFLKETITHKEVNRDGITIATAIYEKGCHFLILRENGESLLEVVSPFAAEVTLHRDDVELKEYDQGIEQTYYRYAAKFIPLAMGVPW